MQKNYKRKGLVHLMYATKYSIQGFKFALTETAFRHELLLCVIACPVAFIIGQSNIERVLLIASIIAILIVELINTAIEAVVDRISLAHHPLSGLAKDLGSAAVLLTLLNALFVWLAIIVF